MTHLIVLQSPMFCRFLFKNSDHLHTNNAPFLNLNFKLCLLALLQLWWQFYNKSVLNPLSSISTTFSRTSNATFTQCHLLGTSHGSFVILSICMSTFHTVLIQIVLKSNPWTAFHFLDFLIYSVSFVCRSSFTSHWLNVLSTSFAWTLPITYFPCLLMWLSSWS